MLERTRGSRSECAHEQGFSLIEVLIASVVFLFIALGIIPLFTMSATSNLQGQDSTRVANLAREHLEELMQLRFDDPLLEITAGTDHVDNEYYDKAADQWKTNPGTPPPGTLIWRVTTVRQYDVADLSTPIDATVAASDPNRVQVKLITVEIHSTRAGGALGGGKETTVQAYKSI